MLKFYKLLFILLVSGFLLTLTVYPSSAATLNTAFNKDIANIGDSIVVDIKIDSEGIGINAAQATLKFPADILEVTNLSKENSIFNFWLEEPNYSNAEGKVSFTGGALSGFSGKTLQILRINFKVKGIGTNDIVFLDGAITASDGSGTNVLSELRSSKFTGLIKGAEVPTKTPTAIPAPVQIVREPATAAGTPVKPSLIIPLYPNPDHWYNLSSAFNVRWVLPGDITGIATAINRDPMFSPSQSEGLFDNKTFGALQDGIWYLHVRFQNNIGWGPETHYRLAIDTQPPLGFELTILEGERTDNPAPTLQFKTSDALSGLKEHQIRIGDGDLMQIPASSFKGTFKLPLQPPGKREVVVRALDTAENSVENRVTLDILPITSPAITFITTELFSDEEKRLGIKGTTLPNISVLLAVRRTGAIVADGIARSDEKGNWEFTFDNSLRNGRYLVTAQSQDERGALSLVVESPEVRVKSKPIIQIGKFQLGMGGALIFLLIVIAGGFGGGVWFYKKRQDRLALRLLVIKTDMAKVFKLIQDDIEKLQQAIKTPTEADDEFMRRRLQENIKKMEGYLKKEIEKLE